MKARNDEERKILELSKNLPTIYEYDVECDLDEIALNICDAVCYNASFYVDGKRITSEWCELDYFAQMVKVNEYQVVRYFAVRGWQKGVMGWFHYKGGEIAQKWYKNGKQVAYLAKRAHNYHHSWCFNAPMELRNVPYDFRYINGIRILSCTNDVFKTKDYKKYIAEDTSTFCSTRKAEFIFTPFGEFLSKCETDIFAHLLREYDVYRLQEITHKYEAPIKIAHRHHYHPTDIKMWFDHLDILANLGLDLHSPHYVCPMDLETAHHRLLERWRRLKAKKDLENEILKIKNYEPIYAKTMGKYLGLCIVGDGLTIQPLQSVMEVYQEGAAMHHCVYQCGYYKHKDTLLLSAKDDDGNRVETIEIDTKNGTIKQSRGVCNKSTERHDDIINLLTKEMWQITSIYKGKRVRKSA